MEQMAVVKSVQSNGMAQVSVRRTTACAHDCDKCAGCEQLNTRMENTVLAYNDAQASPGDLVRLQSENATFFKTAAIVYVLPLVLALVFYGVASVSYTHLDVYKRQVYGGAENAPCRPADSRLGGRFGPVHQLSRGRGPH